MGPESRQRISLVARVAAGLIAVGYVLSLAARAGGGQHATDTATPSPTHPLVTATPSLALPAPAPTIAPAPVAVTTLCQVIPSLVQFSVQALYLPAPDGGINVSNSVTVTTPALTRGLARQLCALPAAPASAASCRGGAGHWTQFIFSAADGGYWTVWADTGGCGDVLGVGSQTRTAAPGGRLWSTVVTDLRAGHQLGSPAG
jgi:hypothetical protein